MATVVGGRASRLVVFLLCLGAIGVFVRPAGAQSLAAVVLSPANGANGVDLGQSLAWSSVPSADAYYLYVGSTPGAKDLLNTGEIQATSYPARTLPADQVLYVRLWTKVSGVWRYTDSSFTGVAVAATLLYPSNGQTTVDLTRSIAWTPIPTADAYYLYVGTTPGAKDLINSGETQLTCWPAFTLPANTLVYVRLWTHVGGIWRFVDSSFTGTVLAATMLSPVNGTGSADFTVPVQWTAVPGAQAYYLYVGSSPGASDLINSGEVQQTSYLASTVPTGVCVYARLWTKVDGVWRYTDSRFTGAVVGAKLTSPADGATDADPAYAAAWTSVANAQCYYLYVGTQAGGRDVVDSGETLATSFTFTTLPEGRILYARLWTKAGGIWRYRDSTFSASVRTATLTSPTDGSTDARIESPATWSAVSGAQKYYLYVGRSRGAADLVNSGETVGTSWPILSVPPDVTAYVRLWTMVGGIWRYKDSTFTAGRTGPAFVFPRNGQIGVDASRPVEWKAAADATASRLTVGSTVGGTDLLDTGEMGTTSASIAGLPAGVKYARAWSKVGGEWSRHTDIVFTTANEADPVQMVAPLDGDVAFDAGQPFVWTSTPFAQAYRLTVGTTPGASELHDSGEIAVTRRYVPGLPQGTPLYGRLQVKMDGSWMATDFTFTVTAETTSAAARLAQVFQAANVVRTMADDDDRPFGWTPLLALIAPRYDALCSDYADMLLAVLGQMNVGLAARRVDVSFNGTNLDAHTLVEVQDPDSGRWLMIDPTFDLAVKRADGQWASADDLSAMTRAATFDTMTYVFLGAEGDAYVRSYYIDYPLLFVNVYRSGNLVMAADSQSGPNPILSLLTEVSIPLSAPPAHYAVQCQNGSTVSMTVDTMPVTASCNGVESTSPLFGASTIESADPASVRLFLVPRFVF